jgi:hypothetical protein
MEIKRKYNPSKKGGTSKLCCGDLRVILNYMFAELEKKKSGAHMGIFTVSIVVLAITVLQAVAPVVPIIFV